MVEFRKRRKTTPATPAQRDQAFVVEPHGRKQDLPKSLQNVSIDEIPKYVTEKRRRKMTEEEREEEDEIDRVIEDTIRGDEEVEKKKGLLTRLNEAIDKAQKRARLKKALDEAKAEEKAHESESGDGYAEYQEELEKARKRQEDNEVFG